MGVVQVSSVASVTSSDISLGGVASGGGGGVESLTLIGHIGDIASSSINGVGDGLDTAI